VFGKQAFCCFLVVAMSGCSAATQYETGAIVLDIREPGALTASQDTTPEFVSAYDAIEAENYTQAEALLEKALAQTPKDPYALLAMGSVHERTGRFSTATSFYQSADHYGTAATGPKLVNGDQAGEGTQRTVSDVARENLAQLYQQGATKR